MAQSNFAQINKMLNILSVHIPVILKVWPFTKYSKIAIILNVRRNQESESNDCAIKYALSIVPLF